MELARTQDRASSAKVSLYSSVTSSAMAITWSCCDLEKVNRRSRPEIEATSSSPWIMMRSATDLSKADLHVFSKLFADGLERGQEAKAFSGRQIGGHDDVLDFFVGHLINVEMTRQPAP